jgi:hypothetical protein
MAKKRTTLRVTTSTTGSRRPLCFPVNPAQINQLPPQLNGASERVISPNPPASMIDTICSLALLPKEQNHEAGNHHAKKDRHQNSAVSTHPAESTHPAAAPPVAIHHGSVLRQGNAGGQQGHRTNNHSKQSFHDCLRKNKNAFEREGCAHARVHAGDTARRFGTVT